jgi:hypothetical protein
MKLSCRIRYSVEKELPPVFAVMAVVLIYAVLAFFTSMTEAAILMVGGVVAVVAIVALACILYAILMGAGIGVKSIVGFVWNGACSVAKVDDYKKSKIESKVSNASMWILALVLVGLLVLFVVGLALDGRLIDLLMAVGLLVVLYGGLGLLFWAFCRFGPKLYEKFWELMGCPSAEKRAAIARQMRNGTYKAPETREERLNREMKEFLENYPKITGKKLW